MADVEVLDTDITTLEVDAIANAANTRLLHGGGVAGAIARAAGEALQRESAAKAPIDLGGAVETTGGDLPARWVIHAATMQLGGPTSADIIRRATAATLWKADELGARSLALEVAYGLARARVLMVRNDASGLDVAALRAEVERASMAMEDVRRIKSQLTSATSGIEQARSILEAMAAGVRGHLEQLDALLTPAVEDGTEGA